MSQRIFGNLLSWLIGVAALGFFYPGEALAVCCKSSTGCSCTTALTCTSPKIKVSSCSTSGGGITLNGSTIRCISSDQTGTVAADPDSPESGVGAIWTETGQGVFCQKFDDSGNPLGSGKFDLFLEYKMTAAAECNNATGVLTYEAFCGPDVTVKGTMKPNTTDGTPQAPWVAEMCTDSKDQLVNCTDPVLALGGFQLTNKGIPDPKKCLTDFPNQSPTGLPAGQVLRYTEQFAPNTKCTGPRISATDAKRRMCHDNTFFNPGFETTGTTTNPPCDPQKGGTVTFRAGISATDTADIVAATLEENQWRPNSTLNLSCNNQGTVPTTIRNSENFAASSFQFADGPIVAYVKGFPGPGNEAEATSATAILTNGVPTGLRVTFSDCTTNPLKPGLDEVICKAIVAKVIPPNATTVDLTILGEQADEQGLGFIGDSLAVPINNAKNCESILNQ